MKLSVPPIDPVATVRDIRANYVNMRRLLMQEAPAGSGGTGGVPAGVIVATPQERPIQQLNLPPALVEAMAAYRKAHPEATSLTPVKYMRTVNGEPNLVVE